jgi:monoamine oxidase
MSLLYLLWYTATNGGLLAIANDQAGGPQQFGVRGGLGGMARTMADRFQGELRMGAPVTRVARGESGFVVTLGDGRSEVATDVVIAAAPSAVARQIAFEPPVPESTRRFLDQPMGHAIKAVLEYETRWWWEYPNGDKYQFYAGKAGGVFEWMLDTSEPARGVNRFAVFLRAPQDIDRNALLERVKAELFALTEDRRCLEVSRFEYFDWARTPYIGGGPVTICTPGALTSGPDRELSGDIHFAGAEYSDQFTGYVEGALRSGTRAAARILKMRPDPALSAGGVRWVHLAIAAAAYAPVALAVEILRWLHRPASPLRG